MFINAANQLLPYVPAAVGEASYIIYVLRERATGRHYVGLTCRTLPERIAAHLSQARRDKPVRPNGLMEAIRRALAAGQSFAEAFEARVADEAQSVDEARRLERLWIDSLDAAQPIGFNAMPGGSSIGPQGNARVLPVPGAGAETSRSYPTIRQAIADRNRTLRAAGRKTLSQSVVYFRLASGWPVREALGMDRHADGRGRRQVVLAGQEFDSLRAASIATGVDLQTLRSRLHRMRQAQGGDAGVLDIGTDRRAAARRQPLLGIIWPETGERLTVKQVAARTGVPAATILHRWHRVMAEQDAAGGCPPAPAALLERLTSRTDRRKVLRLELPGGEVLVGGERELVRQVIGDRALTVTRPDRLSASGIRRRLRLLSEAERQDQHAIRWAFGLSSRAGDDPAAEPSQVEP